MNESATPGPEITTTAGVVRGLVDRELGIQTWRGVPFGADTSGSQRFRAPQPPNEWRGVKDATAFGPRAPQPTYSWTDRVIGSEDCLNLDIVRPDNDDQLPVVVYLHGGSFIMGASHERMLRGYHLATTMQVVYVAINFRLGALGYLDLRSIGEDCVANPAVRDQILALQWVQSNIAAFGGDPDNVTLMGESAGGASVTTLMGVSATRGLFHRAIAQSPPISVLHSRAQATLWARELVYRMALPRQTTLSDLRQMEAADLVRAGQSMMWRGGELLHLNSCYAPTVDGGVVPDHPMNIFQAGQQAQVPLLIGTNSDEASFSKLFYMRTVARSRAALRLLTAFDPEHAPRVLAAYDGATERTQFAELLADALFWAPSIRLASDHSQMAPTWMYRFDYAPAALRWLGIGAMHSLELSAVFGDPAASRTNGFARLGGMDGLEELTQMMQYHWGQFIHHGHPGSEWPAYRRPTDDTPGRATAIFDDGLRVVYDPKAARRRAWEDYRMIEWGNGRPELLENLGLMIGDELGGDSNRWAGDRARG
ncbi:carboxylesterase/lipase family protein [Corynebacterium alimapuense]|uniref:Carboxylic ester hydrolase n=1 Tax=Corynebacterium alimapuense TaxID=1576874 RepID=A0A3M8K7D9_9CORY|nr:carboxylesterase/lipase family protein [Corynebacterium alimapuense]RNE48675.1 carboxylesterase [Corynebacterium alimapuense]